MVTNKPTLWFLPFLLFFLMNGHGINGRDLKVELQDHTDHGKHNESYTVNNIKTTSDSKPNHPSDQPYLTSYGTFSVQDANKPNYLTGYRTVTHDSDKDFSVSSTNNAYITGYKTIPPDAIKDQKESRYGIHEPYITQYGGDLPPSKRDSNAPYITQYGDDIDSKRDSNVPYITQYGGDTDFKGDSNTPYITQYGDEDGSKRDSYAPYITQYGGDVHSKGDSNAPYITQYGDDDGSKRNSNVPYITQYGNNVGSKKDSDAPYITQYGRDIDPKRDSNALYIAEYGLHSKKTHTEAFKVGFFAMDDLYIGNIMTLQFPVEEFSQFLSKKEADSIPFSIPQLPSVLQLFSISQDSPQAKSMRGTIEQCQAGTITGETKICANSLESMLEFVDSIIGSEEKHNIHTTSPPSGAPLQEYSILKISEDIYAPKWVACHPLPYPYAVYYCHFISTGTRVFKVLLGGQNGDKVEALGVCHLDTSDWSPNHILFKQLGFMPGEAPVCHFFPVKHLMWVPQPSTATM